MNREQAELYRQWVRRLEATDPELSEGFRMVIARERAMLGVELPPLDHYRPPAKKWSLPWWASTALAVGGKALVRALIGTKYRAALSIVFGAYLGLCSLGVLPEALCVHSADVGAILVETGVVDPTPPAPTPGATPGKE